MENPTSSSTTPPSPEENKQPSKVKLSLLPLIILGGVVAVVGLGLITYFGIVPYFTKEPPTSSLPTTTSSEAPTSSASLPPPSLPSNTTSSTTTEPPLYTTLEQEFPELINNKSGLFSPHAKELLKKNNFVVLPGATEEFFKVYKTNQEDLTPNFITTDSLLHTAHLIFTHLDHTMGNQNKSSAALLTTIIEQQKLRSATAVYVPTIFGSATGQKILINERWTTSTDSLTMNAVKDPGKYDLFPLLPLITTKPGNLPAFMTSEAWGYKNINTFLGHWTELISRATTTPLVLNDGTGGPGSEIEVIDDRGYVEPEPLVYARVAELAGQTRKELEKTKKLSARDRSLLTNLEKTATTLKSISESEINKIPLSEEAHHFIKNYGNWLEGVVKTIESRESTTLSTATTITTAATLPDKKVLQSATGKVFDILVIVTVNGKQKLAHGGVYSYYEFTKPAEERLSPAAWHELVSNSTNLPDLPRWTDNFVDTSVLGITK